MSPSLISQQPSQASMCKFTRRSHSEYVIDLTEGPTPSLVIYLHQLQVVVFFLNIEKHTPTHTSAGVLECGVELSRSSPSLESGACD